MSRAHSSFIPADQVHAATGWEFGAVDQASLRFAARLKAQAEEEDRSREQAAHADGFAAGFAQGHAQAVLEGQRLLQDYIDHEGRDHTAMFATIFEHAQAGIAESEQILARGVLDLAVALARQVLRHEVAVNPNAIEPVVRDALQMLTTDAKAATVRLHPIDFDVMAPTLAAEYPHLGLILIPDPALARGGCMVECAGTVVDATLPRRWAKAVHSLGLEEDYEEPSAGEGMHDADRDE